MFSTFAFNAADVESSTVSWRNPEDLSRIVTATGTKLEDVDGDGRTDLVASFRINELVSEGVLDSNSTTGVFVGDSPAIGTFAGTDTVNTKRDKKDKKK